MISFFIVATWLGLLIDSIIGDPPKLPHPVRFIGNLITFLSKKLNHGHRRKFKGMLAGVITVCVTVITVLIILYSSYHMHFWLGFIVETLLIAIGLAQKSLKEAALAVYQPLLQGDFTEARQKLSWIVGRDTAHLDEDEIVRGVVETVSENTSDGVTAPLFYALLFGATGLWAYKAINTLDSMIGYKNDKYREFGTFSARLDDVANIIPSRLTGLCIILFTKNTTTTSLTVRLQQWRYYAKKHPSPNSGWLEAATAVQMGVQLGGWNRYEGVDSYREVMGEKTLPLTSKHIIVTIRQMQGAVLAFTVITSLLIGGIFYAIT